MADLIRTRAALADENVGVAYLAHLFAQLRPKLHRYCARMAGSFLDGEDAVQETFAKAVAAVGEGIVLANPGGWLFRIAHRVVLDLHRRRVSAPELLTEDIPHMLDPTDELHRRFAAAAALRTFMHLPSSQRSCVILMDVLGHSLKEVAETTGLTVPAVKAALHRGRARLRELSTQTEAGASALTPSERALLHGYVERFNARDFDAVRAMLSEEIRLDLVARTTMKGRLEVGEYFGNYGGKPDWVLAAGCVEGRPAVLVCDSTDPDGAPRYFILLEWRDRSLTSIRDFRYAGYAIEGVAVARL